MNQTNLKPHQIERIREKLRKKAYEKELKGEKVSTIKGPTSVQSVIHSFTDYDPEDSYHAASEVYDKLNISPDSALGSMIDLVKDLPEPTINYLFAQTDYKYFAKKYLGHIFRWDWAPRYHDPYFDIIRKIETHQMKTPAVIAGPREWGKTQLGGVLLPLHCIIFPNYEYYHDGRCFDTSKKYIMYISVNLDMAVENMGSVLSELEENELIINDFGHFFRDPERQRKRRKDWSKRVAETENGKRLRAFGRKGKIRGTVSRGRRPDLAVCDDLEDDENTKFANFRQQQEFDVQWLRNTVYNALSVDTGNLLMLGNLVNKNGLIDRLIQEGREKNWYVKVFKVFEKDEDTGEKIYTWPEKFGPQFEEERKSVVGEEGFELEYLQNPDAFAKDLSWSDIKYYHMDDIEEELDDMYIFGAIDVAGTQNKRSDFTALCPIAYSPVTKITYVLPAFIGKINTIEQAELVLNSHADWEYFSFGVENVAYQSALKERVEEMCYERGIHMHLEPLTRGSNVRKQDRIANRLFGRVHDGLIKFLVDNDEHKIILDQLINIETTSKDDAVDALEMAVNIKDNWYLKLMSKKNKKKRVKARFPRARVIEAAGPREELVESRR